MSYNSVCVRERERVTGAGVRGGPRYYSYNSERERERERQLLALGFVAVLDTIRTDLLHVLLNSVKFKLFYNRGTGQNFTTVL